MNRIQHIAIAFAISLAAYSANGAEKGASAQSRSFSHWAGSWKISEEANRLLGFADDESRGDVVCDHPLSFRLSLDTVVGENMNADKFEMIRNSVFRQMDHRIVATGKWETEFRVDPEIETDCFVTQHDGRTFLWVGAPYVVVFGGKVAFIQGSNPSHDLMVINFNAIASERTLDSVVYKRNVK